MKARTVLAVCFGAWLGHLALAHYFAERDLVAALLVQRDWAVGLLALALLGLRFFLVLLAPGWLLWLALRRVERELASRRAESERH